jgi:hypothetical protein
MVKFGGSGVRLRHRPLGHDDNRLARYSGEACRSPIRLPAGTLMPSSAEASNFFASAASISLERNTPSSPAPVTATRTPSLPLATNTPVMA